MESNQPPTTYQIVMLPLQHRTAVGKVGVEPTLSCSQGTRAAVALPPGVVRRFSSPYGSRTHLSVLNGRNPQTDRRTSLMLFPPVGREALESSSAAFQAAAKPSQLPTRVFRQTNEKRPGVAGTPGLQVVRILGFGRASQAQWESRIIRGERGITRPYAFLDRTGP